MPKQSQFRAESKEAIQWRLQNEYPSHAKARAEKVTVGGLFGMFTKQYFEVFVEIPDEVPPPGVGSQPAPAAAGVATLLMEADLAEAKFRTRGPEPHVSTDSPDFDELMNGLEASVRENEPTPELVPDVRAPDLLKGAGEVVLVVGIGHDALTAARALGATVGSAEIRTAGSAMMGGFVHVVARQSLEDARAAGHRTGRVVIVAFGIGHDGSVRIPALSELPADQLWLAVDATKKTSDTEAWVRKVSWVRSPDALFVLGADYTRSPESVDELGVPVGWVDGRSSLSAGLPNLAENQASV